MASTRNSRAEQQRELAGVHLGHQHLPVGRQDLAGVGRERVQVAQVRGRDLAAAARARAAPPARIDAERRAPAEHQQLGAARRRRPRAAGCRSAMPATLLRAQAVIALVVGGVVADVAGAVLLLQPADAVREPGRARRRPRPRAAARRARRAGTRSPFDRRVRERRVDRRQRRRRRGSATAPTSSTGTCRTAGSPACGT